MKKKKHTRISKKIHNTRERDATARWADVVIVTIEIRMANLTKNLSSIGTKLIIIKIKNKYSRQK